MGLPNKVKKVSSVGCSGLFYNNTTGFLLPVDRVINCCSNWFSAAKTSSGTVNTDVLSGMVLALRQCLCLESLFAFVWTCIIWCLNWLEPTFVRAVLAIAFRWCSCCFSLTCGVKAGVFEVYMMAEGYDFSRAIFSCFLAPFVLT